MNSHSGRPLDRFPALRSFKTSQIENTLASVYGARKFAPLANRGRLWAHANHWQGRNISLSYCSYGERVEVEFPEAGFFRQQITIRGGGDIRMGPVHREISENSYCVVPPDTTLRIEFRPGFEQVVLRVDADFLKRKVYAICGNAKLMPFDFRAHPGGPAMSRLRRLINFLIAELEHGGLSELELCEWEQSVAVTFFQANPHTGMEPAKDGDRRQAVIVEDYIEAHWHEPLSIVALAGIAGVSARSVFSHFRAYRGMSPMAFVKQVRLRHAREMLVTCPQMTVTEIAFACGFGNLGHFSRYYRECWGERPSDTRKGLA